MATLYHISPENFSQFTCRYHRAFKTKGFFVSRLKSCIWDWMPYVFHRKEKNKNYTKKPAHYSHLYLYELHCQKATFEKIKNFFWDTYHEKDRSEVAIFSFWLWGEQYFITEEMLKEIKIVKKTKISYSDFLDMLKYDNWYKRNEKSKKEYGERIANTLDKS